jgi:hypothetical protein
LTELNRHYRADESAPSPVIDGRVVLSVEFASCPQRWQLAACPAENSWSEKTIQPLTRAPHSA